MTKEWNERMDFVEVYSHQAVVDIFRDRLKPHGFRVWVKRQGDDGRGSIGVEKRGSDLATIIPYHLPEDLERLERMTRQVITSEDNYRGSSRLEI
jgi:hypothetical protein